MRIAYLDILPSYAQNGQESYFVIVSRRVANADRHAKARQDEVRRNYWQVAGTLREAPGQIGFFKVDSVGKRRRVQVSIIPEAERERVEEVLTRSKFALARYGVLDTSFLTRLGVQRALDGIQRHFCQVLGVRGRCDAVRCGGGKAGQRKGASRKTAAGVTGL